MQTRCMKGNGTSLLQPHIVFLKGLYCMF